MDQEECTLEELCSEYLRPWKPLRCLDNPDDPDADGLDLPERTYSNIVSALAGHRQPLRALRLFACDIRANDLVQLLRMPILVALEALFLPACPIAPDGAVALGVAPLPRLRLVDLRQTEIGDDGAVALALSPLAQRLDYLAVAGSCLTAVGLNGLLASPLGARPRALHVEEEGQESLIPSIMEQVYTQHGPGGAEGAFARLLHHPALTPESRNELRHQWRLVMSSS